MDFDKRLAQAIERGKTSRTERDRAEQQKTLTVEELRNIHSAARLNVSEHVEKALRQLSDHFPGFRFETIVDDSGWGARITRDDLRFSGGSRTSLFSRFQILVKPFVESVLIVEVVAKGTVQNKEVLTRSNYQFLAEFDEVRFLESVELWVLEFAEKYAATM